MGYAGNKEPQFIMPSAIAVKETAKVVTLMHVLVRYWIPNPECGLICVIICQGVTSCVHERGRNQISPFWTQVMFSVFRGPKYDDIRPNHTKKYQKITFKVLFSLPPKIH